MLLTANSRVASTKNSIFNVISSPYLETITSPCLLCHSFGMNNYFFIKWFAGIITTFLKRNVHAAAFKLKKTLWDSGRGLVGLGGAGQRPGWDDVKAPFSCQIISVLYVFILLDSGHDHFVNGARAERETNFNEAITLRGTAIENPYCINNLLWHSCGLSWFIEQERLHSEAVRGGRTGQPPSTSACDNADEHLTPNKQFFCTKS